MTKKSLLFLLVLYIASSAVSYGVFAMNTPGGILPGVGPEQVAEDPSDPNSAAAEGESELAKLLNVTPQDPKTEVCPLNGQKYTVQEREAWEKKRPLAIMIENAPDARPQSGMSQADVVYEAVAEGGVTRFMGMFYCDAQAFEVPVAPVRSARIYFMELARSYNRPLYAHVGGANLPGPADALGTLSEWGWRGANDMDEFAIGFPTYKRDYNRIEGKTVAHEHTMVSTTEKLWTYAAEKRKWTNLTPVRTVGKKTTGGEDWKDGFTDTWKFQDGKPGAGSVSPISFEFWDDYSQYAIRWEYDAANNSYRRFMAGESHVDHNTGRQILAKNAVVMLTEEKGPIDEKKHMLYKTTGTGDALIFQNGIAIKGKWARKTLDDLIIFTDEKGKEVEMVRGLTWISMVGLKTPVSY